MLIGDTQIALFLEKDFYNALGENKTIETLVIDFRDAKGLNFSRNNAQFVVQLA
jgi:hypothetical protein